MILCSIKKITASCISFVTLFLALSALRAGVNYWDGGTVSIGYPGNGLSEGGSGNWNTTLANWDNGSLHLAWPTFGVDNDAYFGGTGGTITLASAVTVNELMIDSLGYSFVGTGSNRITLNGSSPTINIGANFTTPINVGVSGTAGLIKAGNGILAFTNTLPAPFNNNYAGGTFINAGTLAVVSDLNFGAASSNITLNGGTLRSNAVMNLITNRQIALGVNNGTISLNSTSDFRVQGLITGGGSLTITGNGLPGSYIPAAANTYTGDTYLGVGSSTTPNANSVGVGGAITSGAFGRGILYLDGGTIRKAAASFTVGNTVKISADTVFLSSDTSSLTFAGPVALLGDRVITAQNTGNIIFSGVVSNGTGASSFILGAQSATSATIVFTAANAYTGGTKIEGGTLRLGETNGSILTTNRLLITSGTLINGDTFTANNAGKLNRVNPSLALELGGSAGGTFTMVGGSAGVAAQQQNFESLIVGRGANSINTSSVSSGNEAKLVFSGAANNFQRTVGGVLNYSSAVGFNPSFLALPTGTGVSGGVLVGVIRDGVDFIDSSSLTFASVNYANDQWSANTPTTITENNVVPFTGSTGSLRFNNPANATVTLSGDAVIQSGNILVTANVGASNATLISGGTLTSGNGTDLIVVQNNGAPIGSSTTVYPAAVTIQSSISDQGSNSIGFTKAGSGVVIISGSTANTFTGQTTILGSGSMSNFAPLILAKPAGTAAIPGNLSIGSTGLAAVYWAASDQIVDQAVVDFQGVPGSRASLQLSGFNETIAGLNDPNGVGVVEVEEQQVVNSNSTITLSGSGDYIFNGTLRNRAGGSGTGILNLVFNGTGSQTLSGANITYTGSTTIQNGTLSLIDTANFASSVTLGNAASTLQVSGNATVMGLTTSGGALNPTAMVQNAAGVSAVLTINQANDTVFGGILRDHPNQVVSSALGISKLGSGVLALTNTNPFSGTVTLNGGVLAVGSNGALGSGTVSFNNANSVIRSLDTNSRTLGNTFVLSTNSTFGSSTTGNLLFTGAVDFGSSNKSIAIQNQQTEFSGIISSTGAGSLTKLGSGSLVMSAPNTYTGATVVSEGTLILSGNRTANSAAITVGNTSSDATLNITNGNFTVTGDFVVGLGNSTGIATVNQTGGTITLSNPTQLVLGKTAGTSNGQYNLSAGTLVGQASTNSGIILGFNNDNQGTFQLSGTGNVSMPSAMLQIGRSEAPADGTTGIFQQTGGIATFGKLSLGGTGGGNNDNTTAILTLTGGSFSAAEYTALAGGDTSSATITIGGTAYVTLPAFPTTRGVSSTARITFDGGTLAPLAASNNYMSGLEHAYLTANGATLDVPSNKDITIAQALSNAPTQAGRLIKRGAGALTLSGNSTYTGSTTISAGRLVVDGSLTSAIEVQANGMLAGSGIIAGDVTGAGNISPGNSIGTLSIEGNYHLTGTQHLEISKDQNSLLTNDQILILGNGELQYDGRLQILISQAELASLTVGDHWDLYESLGSISGTFTNNNVFGTPGDGSDLPLLDGNLIWQFDYQAGVLSINIVPEPQLGVILAVLGLCLLGRNRQRACSKGK